MRVLKRREHFFYLFEACSGFGFCQARELAADHDVIIVARQHESVVLYFDGRYVAVTGENLKLPDKHKKLQCGRQWAEPVTNFFFQRLKGRLIARLGELTIDFDALAGIGNVFERD